MSRYELDHIRTEGEGEMIQYQVYPGIEVYRSSFRAEQVTMLHKPDPYVLEINYCHKGRAGWNMKGGTSVYLGEGDLCLHAMAYCADSEMMLPLGYYEGICAAVDLRQVAQSPPEILLEADLDFQQIAGKYCSCRRSAVIWADDRVQRIFGALYGIAPCLQLPYLKLKMQELLLFLSQEDPGDWQAAQYSSGQTELVKQIHSQLTRDLKQRYTIEELSRQYLLNTSSLKELFKAVYGFPVASYMKEYRVRRAMELLRDTGDSISDISKSVGYETQGKFTKAFKDVAKVLPSEYRKQCRKEQGV